MPFTAAAHRDSNNNGEHAARTRLKSGSIQVQKWQGQLAKNIGFRINRGELWSVKAPLVHARARVGVP